MSNFQNSSMKLNKVTIASFKLMIYSSSRFADEEANGKSTLHAQHSGVISISFDKHSNMASLANGDKECCRVTFIVYDKSCEHTNGHRTIFSHDATCNLSVTR